VGRFPLGSLRRILLDRSYHHLRYGDYFGVVTPSCWSVNVCIYCHSEYNSQNTTHSAAICYMFLPFWPSSGFFFLRPDSKHRRYSTVTVPVPSVVAADVFGTGIAH
jgi:hypothetical protein